MGESVWLLDVFIVEQTQMGLNRPIFARISKFTATALKFVPARGKVPLLDPLNVLLNRAIHFVCIYTFQLRRILDSTFDVLKPHLGINCSAFPY